MYLLLAPTTIGLHLTLQQYLYTLKALNTSSHSTHPNKSTYFHHTRDFWAQLDLSAVPKDNPGPVLLSCIFCAHNERV